MGGLRDLLPRNAREAGFLAVGWASAKVGWRRLAELGVKTILGLAVAVAVLLQMYPLLRWGLGLGILVALAVWAADVAGGLRLRRNDRRINRTTTDPTWVYFISEFRDEHDRLLTRREGRRHGIRHLVYIGKANDFDQRMGQHQQDKAWWHDELDFGVVPYFSEFDALQAERVAIDTAGRQPRLVDRPRENKQYNPTYDLERCLRMRQLALAA
jgi:hypothetical protein